MDETVPLLRDETLDRPQEDSRKDSDAVDFDPRGDLDNPREWPSAYKWSIVALLAFTSFTVYVTLVFSLSKFRSPDFVSQNIYMYISRPHRQSNCCRPEPR